MSLERKKQLDERLENIGSLMSAAHRMLGSVLKTRIRQNPLTAIIGDNEFGILCYLGGDAIASGQFWEYLGFGI